ncbi:MAG TPA: ChaN family lipoprotein [Nitrospirota bacterium]|nr:ChaN family lipoprotein [Nitrospirota bacterium]
MKLKSFFLAAIPLTVMLLLVTTAMVTYRPVFSIDNGRKVSFADMIKALRGADFVFVGEIHDDPDSHVVELGAIRALRESGALAAIGLEMFREDSQQKLDAWVAGTLPLEKFLPVYYDNWRAAWPLYRDIFLYARKHRIPLVGLNITGRLTAAVAENGFASLSADEKRKLPPNITCTVDATYREFIRRAYAGHSPREDKSFRNFCEAQMVWDKSMAWNLIKYRNEHPAKTIVVLAGVGHAWRRGVPEQIALQSSYSVKVVMPVVPDQISPKTASLQDADFLVLD